MQQRGGKRPNAAAPAEALHGRHRGDQVGKAGAEGRPQVGTGQDHRGDALHPRLESQQGAGVRPDQGQALHQAPGAF